MSGYKYISQRHFRGKHQRTHEYKVTYKHIHVYTLIHNIHSMGNILQGEQYKGSLDNNISI